jgi:hypothetical protein
VAFYSRIRRAVFHSLTRFEIEVIDRQRADRSYTGMLELRGLEWKLTSLSMSGAIVAPKATTSPDLSEIAMRKLLIAPLVLMLAYLAWPLAAAWQLRVAVKASDVPAIESKVDWTTLRANLKQTVGSNLKEKSTDRQRGLVTRVLIGTLGPAAAGAVIDITVTPVDARQGAGRAQPARRSRHDAAARGQRVVSRGEPCGRPRRRSAGATPSALGRSSKAPPASSWIDRSQVARQARGQHPRPQGVRWKLVDVYYVTPPVIPGIAQR